MEIQGHKYDSRKILTTMGSSSGKNSLFLQEESTGMRKALALRFGKANSQDSDTTTEF